jgi:hypothetical protein
MDSDPLRQRWLGGQGLEVGRQFFAPLEPAGRVALAAAVLDACRKSWGGVPAVQAVLALAAEPARWNEGRKAFDELHALTLKEEQVPTSPVYRALLLVAENVAKTLYDASGPAEPLDPESPFRVVSCASELVRVAGQPVLEEAVWRALRGVAAGTSQGYVIPLDPERPSYEKHWRAARRRWYVFLATGLGSLPATYAAMAGLGLSEGVLIVWAFPLYWTARRATELSCPRCRGPFSNPNGGLGRLFAQSCPKCGLPRGIKVDPDWPNLPPLLRADSRYEPSPAS